MHLATFFHELETTFEMAPGSIATGEEKLASLCKWDSMAILSFISMVDDLFSQEIESSSLAECQTPEDLAKLCGGHIEF